MADENEDIVERLEHSAIVWGSIGGSIVEDIRVSRSLCRAAADEAEAVVREIVSLRADLAAATAERHALIESCIGEWRGGGYTVSLPWRREGYPGGSVVWSYGAAPFYHFEVKHFARLAVLAAAGLGPEDRPAAGGGG